MTVGRETVEAALFDGFRGTALGGAHEGWSRNMARIATDAVMPLLGEATTPEQVVELTPVQAGVMLTARQAELDRARHEAEPWLSRAEIDRVKRIQFIEAAVAMGVPLRQVQRFIWGEKTVPKGVKP